MYLKCLDSTYYSETKTFVVDRSNFYDEWLLSFNPSEYVDLNFCGANFKFKRAGIIKDTYGNVIHWTYGALDHRCPIQILQVFNH